MMVSEEYEAPVCEVLYFDEQDIITASGEEIINP